ncbi:MAG: P-II family nitrogen regulator [Bacteroidota bacterium]
MMNLLPVKLVTIVALDSLSERIVNDIKVCGSKGYTISAVEGEGMEGKHFTDWEGRNVRIDTLVKEDVAIRIMQVLAEKYFGKYSVIAFVTDAQVMRKDRF